eukprot:605346-Prymnesium_polylepis.1
MGSASSSWQPVDFSPNEKGVRTCLRLGWSDCRVPSERSSAARASADLSRAFAADLGASTPDERRVSMFPRPASRSPFSL